MEWLLPWKLFLHDHEPPYTFEYMKILRIPFGKSDNQGEVIFSKPILQKQI